VKVEVVGDPLPYGMLYHPAGKILDLPDDAARTFIKIGRAKPLSNARRSRRVYRRRDMTAEQTVAVEPVETEDQNAQE
jgi:hypothetical protein